MVMICHRACIATQRRKRKALAVVGSEVPQSGVAKALRLLQYRVEDRREITRRGIDHLQDLGGRRLLLQRFARL